MKAGNPDILLTMQEDLGRALDRPPAGRRWGMLIDTRKCVNCRSCTIGCIAENVLPPGVVYRPVFEEEEGRFPRVLRRFIPRPCMHCDRPPCVGICPKKGKATYKSEEGVSAGLVLVDYRECIRCDKCIKVCPYRARSRDEGKYFSEKAPFVPGYEKRPSGEYGRSWPREPASIQAGTARKCHFCLHRIRKGLLPMCASTCVGRATYFGDLNDPGSLIARVKKANTVQTIKSVSDPDPAKGRVVFGGIMNQPRVYYILGESHGGK